MTAELQTMRGRIYFWIGIVVFPVFWVWWMNVRQFTSWQIRGARIWTGLYVLAAVAAWWVSPEFRSRLSYLPWNYSFIAFEVGVVLWIWLLFRTVKFSKNVFGFLICLDMIGTLYGQLIPIWHEVPPHPASLLFILIPAVAHLLIEPVRRH